MAVDTDDCRIAEDDTREDFFVDQILRGADGARSVLILLGDMHVEATAEKLARMGHRVVTNHELVPVKRWE